MTQLLVFLRGDELAWLRLDGERVVARGTGAPAAEPADTVIAVAPGEAVTLHWVEMPDLAPAQAAAAGRIAAAEVCAAPSGATHVAVGARDADGYYPVAVVEAAAMAAWLERCREAGLDPDRVVAAPLLIQLPAEGVRVAEAGDVVLVRGRRLGFAAEPELAALLIGDAVPEKIDSDAFEADLAAALDEVPVDLRQGPFAKVRPWQLDTRRLRRMALLAALILLALFLVNVVQLLRYSFAADMAEHQVTGEAQALLPRGTEIYDPVVQVRARLAETGGAGGFSPAAAALFAAMRDVPGAQLTILRYDPAGGLVAAVASAQGGDVALLQERLAASGYEASAGVIRSEAERAVVDLTVRRR
ncbi:MAG: type II secretion system protein GspL [Sphingomonadaceae bacterium]|nr:type II secretion system protein GspL [Sphingomonadaceae bacterium]